MKKNYKKPLLLIQNLESGEIFTASSANVLDPNNILNWDDGLWE